MPREGARGGRRAGVILRLVAPLLALGLATSACASNERPRAIQPEYDLHDPDPAVRIQAVHAVARTGDQRMIPQVIEMLDDRDEAVRMVAIGTLRDMTDYDTDYRAYAPQTERQAQVRQWRDWHAASRALPRAGSLAGPETQ